MTYMPLLRWAGGKRWLSKKIARLLPISINRYYEPFCGSCAVYYSLRDVLQNKEIFLSDTNEELINFYKVVQDNPTRMYNYLKEYKNEEEFYYELRERKVKSIIERAAIFYYLNRTSFNGIYRVNLKGVYNVPFGFKQYETLFDKEQLKKHSDYLDKIKFTCQDFSSAMKNACENDFYFIDPPYTVSHNENGFIKYNKKLFSLEDQYRLRDELIKLTEKKAHYLVTNAHHEKIYEIFSKNSNVIEIDRYTSISGNNSGRKKTMEYIFTNYEVKL